MGFQPSWVIYGATGYTGRLIAEAAVKAGMRPILAGRNESELSKLGATLKLSHRCFALDARGAVEKGLSGIRLVLNTAGPFAITSQPIANGALATGAHYLDIAGEVADFRALHRMHERAVDNGVMLLSGVGFGVLPSECLALKLFQLLPHAAVMKIGLITDGGASRGTLETLLNCARVPGVVRKRGQLVAAAAADESWQVDLKQLDLGRGAKRRLISNPWRGDLFSVPFSAAVPQLETYFQVPAAVAMLLRRPQLLQGGWVSRLLHRAVRWMPPGPSAKTRAKSRSYVVAYAIDPDRREKTLLLEGPDAYTVTAECALECVKRVLAGATWDGFATPAQIFGTEPLSLPIFKLSER